MDTMFVAAAMSTPSLVLRYAAAFFFVLVAIALAYALFKAARALDASTRCSSDVDEKGVPLMQKAGTTLDGVNANLGNVDEITKDVADITDKIDTMANAVEGAVTTPARKAAAFSAGVQSAVSSFMRRDKPATPRLTVFGRATGPAAADAAATGGWSTPLRQPRPRRGRRLRPPTATQPSAPAKRPPQQLTVADAAAGAGEAVADAASEAARGRRPTQPRTPSPTEA